MTTARTEVGACINSGYRVLGNYNNAYILAQNMNALSPEPFVVWTLDGNGEPHTGSYFTHLEAAEQEFALRCFTWLMPEEPQRADPEQLIQFTAQYPTHRIGFYKNWMIVQPYDEIDGEIRCYLPDGEYSASTFNDLDYLKESTTPEWEAGNLQEAIEFIDCSAYGASKEDVSETMSAIRGEVHQGHQ